MKKKICKPRIIALLLVCAMLQNIWNVEAIATQNSSLLQSETEIILEETTDKEISENINKENNEIISEEYQNPISMIGEDKEMREANIKYFLNSDFSHTAAIYPKAIHYQVDGRWIDIDNTLELTKLDGISNYVENKSNRMKVSFAADTKKEKLVQISTGQYSLSWNIDTGKRTALRKSMKTTTDLEDKIVYKNINNKTEENAENNPLNQLTIQDDILKQSQDKEALTNGSQLTNNLKANLITENPDISKMIENDLNENNSDLQNSILDEKKEILFETNSNFYKNLGVIPENQEAFKTSNNVNEAIIDSNHYAKLIEESKNKSTLESLISGVTYENISEGVHLEYILDGEVLKENIILLDSTANKQFVYNFQLEGLRPILKNNEVLFKNTKGETILYIQAPFMYDSDKNVSNAVKLSLVEVDGNYQIGIKADEDWLLDPNRNFPVVIDPIISTPTASYEIKDARVCSNYPDSNFRDYNLLTTGFGTNTGDNRS